MKLATILFILSLVSVVYSRRRRRAPQFSQLYSPGSKATNYNYASFDHPYFAPLGGVPYPLPPTVGYIQSSTLDGVVQNPSLPKATKKRRSLTKHKRDAQFIQNYQPGSLSNNYNFAGPVAAASVGGGFNTNYNQQYGPGSYASNYGRKRRSTREVSKRSAQFFGPGYGVGSGFGYGGIRPGLGYGSGVGFGSGIGSNFYQNYGFGSTATNIGK